MPRVETPDGKPIRLVAGGRFSGHRFLRMPALTYTVPQDGDYGIIGSVRAQVWTGLPPVQVLIVHRTADSARVVKQWSLNNQESVSLGEVGIAAQKGDYVSIVAAVFQDNTGGELFLSNYEVGTEFADELALRRAEQLANVIEKPTGDQFRAANALVEPTGIHFPLAANVRNVKAYGAKGDGVTDDTAAIQAAYNRTGLLYFPDGEYLITGQIKAPPRDGSAPARRTIQGQSRDGTIIRLAPQAPGFDNPTKPRAMIVTSYGVAQAFRNSVKNLTLEVGPSNPGAVGIDFFASNSGSVKDVLIRSADPQRAGYAGIWMKGDDGPLLIKNVEVEGFDYGIDTAANQSATFSNITVRNQRKAGFINRNKAFIHGLVSQNAVTALKLEGALSCVIDARLEGGNGGPAITADRNTAFLRNIRSSGYDRVLQHASRPVATDGIEQWTSNKPVTVNGASAQSLNLPIQHAPKVSWPKSDDWALIQDHASSEVDNWASAFQAALNAGKPAVMFRPSRQHFISGHVSVPDTVSRVFGAEAYIRPPSGTKKGQLHIKTPADSTTTEPLVIERFDSIYAKLHIIHRSPRPLIVRHLIADVIELAPGAGDLYIEDAVIGHLDIHGQDVWAWQLNMEGGTSSKKAMTARPNVRNVGGNLWVMGLKTEQNRIKNVTTQGGASEYYAYILANRADNRVPLFITDLDSRVSATIRETVSRNSPFPTVLATRLSSGRLKPFTNYPSHGKAANISLIVFGRE